MSRVLIIGAGGVGRVVAHKCAQMSDVYSDILLASRTIRRCEVVQGEVRKLCGKDVQVAQLDASEVGKATALMRGYKPDLVINAALPYQNLPIMDACLAAGVDYLDTANYQPRDEDTCEYKWQWGYHDRYAHAGIMALLGVGFDPGVINVFCAHAQKSLYDEIHYIDVLDCNAGDHGHPFATSFNSEINIRRISQRGRFWEEGQWYETDPISESMPFDFPEVGRRKAYLLYNEALESLVKHVPGLRRIRFWMTFGDEYLTHLRALQNVGMTSIEPIEFQGRRIIPLEFLSALLPDPAELGKNTTGKTCIGCLFDGLKGGKRRKLFIYNVCEHEVAYEEVRAQAVPYTAGVAAVVGGAMMLTGKWRGEGVFNAEQFDPAPYLDALAASGLEWHVKEL